MSEPDNLRIARQAFDAWNAHDPEHGVPMRERIVDVRGVES